MAPVAHNTSDEISKSPNEVDAQQDLMPFRSSARRVIRAELRKAGLGRSNDIEDIFQDACVIVLKVSRTGCKIHNIESFLLQVCRYSARHYMRKIIRRERIQVRFPTDLVRALYGERHLSESPLPEALALVPEVLPQLPARDRHIIDMMFVEELSDAEMREILRLKEGAFRVAKHRAFQRLLLEILKIVEGRG